MNSLKKMSKSQKGVSTFWRLSESNILHSDNSRSFEKYPALRISYFLHLKRLMGRRKIEYSDIYPFHIYGKSNNSDWFYLPIDDCWRIFSYHLKHVQKKYNFKIHAFVLMDNHYHMIASTPQNNLPVIMNRLISGVSRSINSGSNRKDHVFGGQYQATIIKNEYHYLQGIRYVYQNPVSANLCTRVEMYPYSTVLDSFELKNNSIPIENCEIFESVIPTHLDKFLIQMNDLYSLDQRKAIKLALRKTEYKMNKRFKKKLF